MTERLDFAMSVVRHLESVATTPELRAAFNAVQPKVSAFYSSLPLNEGLWKAIQRYAATAEAQIARQEPAAFFDQDHGLVQAARRGTRSGGQRAAQGDRRRAVGSHHEIFGKCSGFDQRLGTGDLTDETQLAGLAAGAMAAARASAESKGKRGLAIHAAGSQLHGRDDVSGRRGDPRAGVAGLQPARPRPAQHDNAPLLAKILELRKEKAKLLGFPDFADLVLEDRMAHTGAARAKVSGGPARGRPSRDFTKRIAELAKFAGRQAGAWDVGYWAEKQRAKLYDFDEEALRPYFSLERVVTGMFEIFGRLLGIRVARNRTCRRGIPRCKCLCDSMRPAASTWVRFTPTGIRAKTSAAARGWTR